MTLGWLVLASICLLAVASGPALASPQTAALAQAPEWGRLALLWHVMLDHSSDTIYNIESFQGMAKDLDTADQDLAELATRKLLPASVSEELRKLIHARYEYIAAYHYTSRSHISQTALQAAATTARWLVEKQLQLLRSDDVEQRIPPEYIAKSKSSIAYELTFLHHLGEFESGAERRQSAIQEKEGDQKEAELQAFDNDCQRRRNLLLQSYRDHRLPAVRAVRDLMPYLLALNAARPDRRPAAADTSRPGS